MLAGMLHECYMNAKMNAKMNPKMNAKMNAKMLLNGLRYECYSHVHITRSATHYGVSNKVLTRTGCGGCFPHGGGPCLVTKPVTMTWAWPRLCEGFVRRYDMG